MKVYIMSGAKIGKYQNVSLPCGFVPEPENQLNTTTLAVILKWTTSARGGGVIVEDFSNYFVDCRNL